MKKIITNHLILYFYPIWGLVIIPIVNYNYSKQRSRANETVASTFLWILCTAFFLLLFCWFLYRISVQKVTFHPYSILAASLETIFLAIVLPQREVSLKFWQVFYADARYNLLLAFMILSVYAMILVAQKYDATKK